MVPAREKLKALRRLIETQEYREGVLIFCNRKREVASLRRQPERAGLNHATSTAISTSHSAPRRWMRSNAARSISWSRPTLPRASSTS